MVVKKFKAHGKDYEIRLILGQNNEFVISAFHGGKPANGYSYRVALNTAHDLKVLVGQDAVKYLITLAKDDVVQRRYEELLEAIKKSTR
jgi:hypothetical protein